MLHLVYDGHCGFCVRSLAIAQRLDVFDRLQLHDGNDRTSVGAEFPELAERDLDAAMFAVDDKRRVARGFFAFRRLVWESPLTWPLLLLFYLPGASIIGPKVYARVARSRGRFGCTSSCGVGAPPR